MAFKTRNTTQNIVKPRPQIEKYGRNGVYQIKCMDFPLIYVGQTGRIFCIRYKRHKLAIINNNINNILMCRDVLISLKYLNINFKISLKIK
jgi:hypothetical protein